MIRKITASIAFFLFGLTLNAQLETYQILYPSTIGLTMTTGDICTSPFTIEEVHQTTIGNTWGFTWTSIHPGVPTSVQIQIMFSVSEGTSGHPTTLNGIADAPVGTGAFVNCAAGSMLYWDLNPASYNSLGTNTFLVDFSGSGIYNQIDNLDEIDPYVYVVVDYTPCVSANVTPNLVTDVTCFGDSNGSIDINISGGTPGYTYDWDNDGTGDFDDTQDLTGVPAGTYNLTVSDGASCTTNYTVDVNGPSAIDVSVSQTGITLTANATGVTYQWINCFTMLDLPGETSASFTPLSDCNVAVIVTDGVCNDTSACIAITGVGISENDQPEIHVFPNPTNDKLTVQLNSDFKSGIISVIDVNGKIVMDQSINSQQNFVIDFSEFDPGIYILKIVSENHAESVLIVRE